MHHWKVFRAALREAREAEDGRRRQRAETEFLPAALEILETPASPVGRALALLLAGIFTCALLWAYFGRIEVIAVAQGKIVPIGRLQVIQPLEIGIVRAIHVREGDSVKAGQPLVELDPTESRSALEQLETQLVIRRLDVARLAASLTEEDNPLAGFVPPLEASTEFVDAARQWLQQTVFQHRAGRAALTARKAELMASLDTVEAQLQSIARLLPVLKERVSAKEKLAKSGTGTRAAYLELLQEQVELEGEQNIQVRRKAEIMAQLQAVGSEIEERDAAYRARIQEEKNQAQHEIALLTEEASRLKARLSQRTLTAPLDGNVSQVAIHTIGGVVTPAEQILTLVPKDSPLEMEAVVLNKDIGFVALDQLAAIKLEAFPFTKYGVIEGKVSHIASDAVNDERLGLVYPVKIRLAQDFIIVNGSMQKLSPGMAAAVEIKTGDRRIVEYFLSPIIAYKEEVFRER